MSQSLNKKNSPVALYHYLISLPLSTDFEDKVKLAAAFYDLKQNESAKSNKLVYYDVLSSDEHMRVYTRIFYDEIQALVADESLVFQNKHISLSPTVSSG